MSIVLVGSSSGSITLQEPAVAGTTVLNLPATSGTVLTTGSTFAGTGPAFSAYLNTTQSLTTDVNTIVQCDTEEFDTASCYNTSTYRFTPNVAGYYQVNGQISCRLATNVTRFSLNIQKNGSVFKYGGDIYVTSGVTGFKQPVSALVYMNGTTDYLQLAATVTASSASISGDSFLSNYFQAFLVRAA
jgi:hypothetical protein